MRPDKGQSKPAGKLAPVIDHHSGTDISVLADELGEKGNRCDEQKEQEIPAH